METDRLQPALDLIVKGNIDYIVFECLAERTISLAQLRKLEDPSKGYNTMLEYRLEKALPLAYQHNVKVITNMGAANVRAAAELAVKIAAKHQLPLKVAAVYGDDIFSRIDKYYECPLMEKPNLKLGDLKDYIVSANAYIGYEGIYEALENGADVVITGRSTDTALFMAPAIYRFGWRNSLDKTATCAIAGHLIECSAQVSGGYFAVPGKKEVPDLWNLGFPIAEINERGEVFITKLEEAGGCVTTATCKEQLLYEIHDPANYLTPDVIADCSKISFEEIAKDRVKVTGVTGKPKPDTLKVSVGYLDSYIATIEVSYGGWKCVERAELLVASVKKRVEAMYGESVQELRSDIMGINSLLPGRRPPCEQALSEVRARVSIRVKNKRIAEEIIYECGSNVLNGPGGGGGRVESVKRVVSVLSILIPGEDVNINVEYMEV
jgi:hypothetical protein